MEDGLPARSHEDNGGKSSGSSSALDDTSMSVSLDRGANEFADGRE